MSARRDRFELVGKSDLAARRGHTVREFRSNQTSASHASFQMRSTSWSAGAGSAWAFGVKFGVLLALYYIFVLTPEGDRLLYANLSSNAWLASGILNWFGQDCTVSEIFIRSSRFAIAVRRGCDALEPSCFFGAALLAFPAPFGRKVAGLLGGVVLLQGLNLVRIVTLYFIGIHCPEFFGPAHGEIWPAIFVLAALILWFAWINWSRKALRPATHGST